jgi:hypothetical protein
MGAGSAQFISKATPGPVEKGHSEALITSADYSASNTGRQRTEPPPSGAETGDTALPFSKARCIALVATVTGASFLNVSLAARLVSPQ